MTSKGALYHDIGNWQCGHCGAAELAMLLSESVTMPENSQSQLLRDMQPKYHKKDAFFYPSNVMHN